MKWPAIQRQKHEFCRGDMFVYVGSIREDGKHSRSYEVTDVSDPHALHIRDDKGKTAVMTRMSLARMIEIGTVELFAKLEEKTMFNVGDKFVSADGLGSEYLVTCVGNVGGEPSVYLAYGPDYHCGTHHRNWVGCASIRAHIAAGTWKSVPREKDYIEKAQAIAKKLKDVTNGQGVLASKPHDFVVGDQVVSTDSNIVYQVTAIDDHAAPQLTFESLGADGKRDGDDNFMLLMSEVRAAIDDGKWIRFIPGAESCASQKPETTPGDELKLGTEYAKGDRFIHDENTALEGVYTVKEVEPERLLLCFLDNDGIEVMHWAYRAAVERFIAKGKWRRTGGFGKMINFSVGDLLIDEIGDHEAWHFRVKQISNDKNNSPMLLLERTDADGGYTFWSEWIGAADIESRVRAGKWRHEIVGEKPVVPPIDLNKHDILVDFGGQKYEVLEIRPHALFLLKKGDNPTIEKFDRAEIETRIKSGDWVRQRVPEKPVPAAEPFVVGNKFISGGSAYEVMEVHADHLFLLKGGAKPNIVKRSRWAVLEMIKRGQTEQTPVAERKSEVMETVMKKNELAQAAMMAGLTEQIEKEPKWVPFAGTTDAFSYKQVTGKDWGQAVKAGQSWTGTAFLGGKTYQTLDCDTMRVAMAFVEEKFQALPKDIVEETLTERIDRAVKTKVRLDWMRSRDHSEMYVYTKVSGDDWGRAQKCPVGWVATVRRKGSEFQNQDCGSKLDAMLYVERYLKKTVGEMGPNWVLAKDHVTQHEYTEVSGNDWGIVFRMGKSWVGTANVDGGMFQMACGTKREAADYVEARFLKLKITTPNRLLAEKVAQRVRDRVEEVAWWRVTKTDEKGDLYVMVFTLARTIIQAQVELSIQAPIASTPSILDRLPACEERCVRMLQALIKERNVR